MKPRTRQARSAAAQAHYFASCPRGLEDLLLAELHAVGITDARSARGGIRFKGGLVDAYRACLWSRVASRLMVVLAEIPARDADELYANALDLPWERHIAPGATIAVDFNGVSETLRNTLFGARRVKDAVVDRLRAVSGLRPDVDVRDPDIRIVAHLARDRLTLAIDLVGTQHRRGWRGPAGAAPLKENLAAALLLRAGWPAIAAGGGALYDPMCGSGTLLIEAALIAAGAAVGEFRAMAARSWCGHDPLLYERMLREARTQREAAVPTLPPIAGADQDARVLEHARRNALAAGLGERIAFDACALAAQRRPAAMAGRSGLLICNPPYGERLGSTAGLPALYAELGRLVREEFSDWRVAILTLEGPLEDAPGLRWQRRYRVRNGALDCCLLVHEPRTVRIPKPASAGGHETPAVERAPAVATAAGQHEPGPGAVMFANRVRKNLRRLKGWLASSGCTCYRIYDADIPEYAVAVDRYEDWVHVAEYAPPASIDADTARARLADVCAMLPSLLGVPARNVVLKTRTRQRGTQQYQRLARENHFVTVREGQAQLLVNLHDFLDTGLFLDHRPVRRMVAAAACGKRFLNLFCYTGSVSVFAGLGGASTTTGVDLSTTYLDWARRNLELNGLPRTCHELVRADCLSWLEQQSERWDLVFLDPPSFSNSKNMRATLDVQRDHVALIRAAVRVLADDGLLLFSTNRRGFRLDGEALAGMEVQDLTARSIDTDFTREPPPHRLYAIRRRGGNAARV